VSQPKNELSRKTSCALGPAMMAGLANGLIGNLPNIPEPIFQELHKVLASIRGRIEAHHHTARSRTHTDFANVRPAFQPVLQAHGIGDPGANRSTLDAQSARHAVTHDESRAWMTFHGFPPE
jgi:hypothetical protein